MPRRRYRLFTVVAAVVLFMLYHVAQNSWDQQPPRPVTVMRDPPAEKAVGGGLKPVQKPNVGGNVIEKKRPVQQDAQQPLADKPKAIKDQPKEKPKAIKDQPKQKPVAKETTESKPDKPAATKTSKDDSSKGQIELPKLKGDDADAKKKDDKKPSISESDTKPNVKDKKPAISESDTKPNVKDKKPSISESDTKPDGNDNKPVALNKVPSGPHWTQFPEHYPVPSESVRPLPTGKPANIPKIQHEFGEETEAAKKVRLERLAKVKVELQHAWKGYRENAFMHDELRPVDGTNRDPFNGWAATLVDSLDTLWIAGMKDEFEDALTGVAQLDFTTSTKNAIPVFETTIRYLGGLLSAYDVSEQNYKILLDKASELGNILFSIFDTPNRMPILYYQWKPSSAKGPHHAGQVGIAELGTLSMEFTRLAQLTNESKYYDAIDRITDALIDLGERGTAIPGLFPENLDASGCNRSATAVTTAKTARKDSKDDGLVDVPTFNVDNVTEAKLGKRAAIPEDFGIEVPGDSASKKTDSSGKTKAKSDSAHTDEADDSTNKADGLNPKQTIADKTNNLVPQIPQQMIPHREPMTPTLREPTDDCVPQGLVPWSSYGQRFHMGGAQDSAYEYFTKEYLLLGGLEEKYKKLHIDTVKAVDEYLMYRPMIKDDDNKWDILFPAVMVSNDDTDKDLQATYEIAHLTCFVGGMYGMGGKVFGRPQDVETAKKLADGCVWAYSMTASGIMPEHAILIPCPTLEKCEFNQTLWYDELDMSKEDRDRRVAEWDEKYGSNATKTVTDEADDAESAYIPTRPQTHLEYVEKQIQSFHLPPGFSAVGSRHYILRPEAIESVWYMYRITGDAEWMEKGWKMFEATIQATRTRLAHSAIRDVLMAKPQQKNEMESFWIAETLKYYYLLFAGPDVISLDDWVLNTEAHPMRRPKA